jgi:hypothetical protein
MGFSNCGFQRHCNNTNNVFRHVFSGCSWAVFIGIYNGIMAMMGVGLGIPTENPGPDAWGIAMSPISTSFTHEEPLKKMH